MNQARLELMLCGGTGCQASGSNGLKEALEALSLIHI